MSFVNAAVGLDSLPRAEETPLLPLDPRYPRLVLGVALLVEVPVFFAAAVFVLLALPVSLPARLALVLAAFAVLPGVVWHTHRAASVIRYAVRQHDVIVRTGVFRRKETVQPIKRIQHVELVQGPLEKRLGLSTLRLYSAGTGHVTLRIPGLETDVATRVSAFILGFADQDDGAEESGGEKAPPTGDESERPADG
jgi:hypothetical protein